ncbi:MAG: hypothetical protein M1821_009608 [Bathelium mastoideum]|nr:MAG: hypothetical protein M1821_009608 [Bathelium mastoideum]KAI9688832.1 MAG: hypothetical protein M1822_001189 [Bathelium mastoideum]
MSVSPYDITIAVFIRQLQNLSAYLQKAEAHLAAHSLPASHLLGARLAPDMHPLPFQIRSATNSSRNGSLVKNWAYLPAGDRKDDDATFAAMYARIADTVDWLKRVDRGEVEETVGLPKVFWTSGVEGKGFKLDFESGLQMVSEFLLPNFWFHVTTAYDICRMQGVPLSKLDFVAGAVPLGRQ